ncbi:DUF4097 family beta strand repeat-containing protein [Flavobacteriaceae bacterium 3-367]|uniref:DUF4097 family beta strand repeat-containing protein n=1 Tax=Eudoraea algarum TaxID=3417568 RepID=UPI003291C415
MRNIKILVTSFLMFSVSLLTAQETELDLFTVPLSQPTKTGKLIVNQISGSIEVTGYSGNEIIVKASFGERYAHGHKNKGKTTKNGLKRITNASLDIRAEEKNNVVQIINEQHNRETNLSIKVPVNFSLKLRTINNGDITVQGINGEMEISNVNGDITVLDAGGSAAADTTNGDIKVVFNKITADANMAFSSFNGDVDVSFPTTLKANVKAKSDMGEIYTDFEMAVEKQKPVVNRDTSSSTYKVQIEQWVNGTINGGGAEMLFKTYNGDIVIRAK